MYRHQFERTARKNRHKAIFLTILFHVLLLGAIASSGDIKLEKYIPDTVKSWFGMEQEDGHNAGIKEKGKAPRP